MLRIYFSQLMLLLWKLSTVYIIPIIIISYVDLLNFYTDGFTFEQLDTGQNIHKLSVLAIYLIYLLCWSNCNKYMIAYLKKLEY